MAGQRLQSCIAGPLAVPVNPQAFSTIRLSRAVERIKFTCFADSPSREFLWRLHEDQRSFRLHRKEKRGCQLVFVVWFSHELEEQCRRPVIRCGHTPVFPNLPPREYSSRASFQHGRGIIMHCPLFSSAPATPAVSRECATYSPGFSPHSLESKNFRGICSSAGLTSASYSLAWCRVGFAEHFRHMPFLFLRPTPVFASDGATRLLG